MSDIVRSVILYSSTGALGRRRPAATYCTAVLVDDDPNVFVSFQAAADDSRARGKVFWIRIFRHGMHTQAMPTLTSTTLTKVRVGQGVRVFLLTHRDIPPQDGVELGPGHIRRPKRFNGFFESDDADDADAVLGQPCSASRRSGHSTYKEPVIKTPVKAIFCFLGMVKKNHTTGIGTTRTRMSVRTLNEAPVITMALMLRHEPPRYVMSHIFLLGVQAKVMVKKPATA